MTQELIVKKCICDSGKLFEQCCQPLLSRKKLAKTPVQLMRSRYCAYALGGHGEYLLNTWSPLHRAGLNEVELSMRTTNWVRLEVISKSQNGNYGEVEFKAYFLDDDFNELVHAERSLFQRINGHWYYIGIVGTV